MAVTFQDYYETLGVKRDATQQQIQAAYRKMARKYHPDVSKAPDAEERFKQVNEAYEVLKDPEKRKKYDALGQNWKNGEEFTPPPGYQPNPGHAQEFHFEDFGAGDFSDFFSSLFGQAGAARRSAGPERGEDMEAEMTVPLEDVAHGATRTITLQTLQPGPDGSLQQTPRTLEIRIPSGTVEGARLRLAGQGLPGRRGGEAGDLYIRVHLAQHPLFKVQGRDLTVEVPVTPWEAALGAEIPVPTLERTVHAKLPAGTSSGRKLRLKGQGLPDRKGEKGDLFAAVRIDVPKSLSERERQLFEELRAESHFSPRQRV